MIKKGFTIIELLVVIAVIGVLSTIGMFSFGKYQAEARDSQRSAKAAVLAEALEKYYDNNGEYPGCPAVSNPNTVTITTTVLPGLDQTTLIAPGSAAGVTNSIICAALTSTTEAFGYVGDGSAACLTGAACLSWTLEYREETSGQIGSINSRRNTLIATSGDTVISVGGVTGHQVNLSWTSIDNAVNYTLQRATNSTFTVGLDESTVTGTSTASTGLSTSTLYYFRVRPNAADSVGNWSNTVSATTTNDYGSLAVATSIEGYWTTAPEGFLLEDGSAVSRTTYSDLYGVIGTTYGSGNGSTTFNVPDSRGRTTVNKSTDVEFTTIGQKTGSKTESLSIAQMASHTHIQNSHSHVISDSGHNHTQNPHTHSQNVAAPLAGGAGIRYDYNSDGAGAAYDQGTPTDNAWPTNYASTTGVSINGTAAVNQNTGSGGSHNNIQPSIVKVSAIKYTRIDPAAATLPAGASIQGYWSTAPTDYAPENGAAVSRTTYSALFSAIGTTYGAGDGSSTFNLPDSRGRAGVNISSTDAEFDVMGEKSGSKTEALTTTQIPSHTHTQNSHGHSVSDPAHNHTQVPHLHGMEVSANTGPAIRRDWNGDGASAAYSQGINAGVNTGTNAIAGTDIVFLAATATNQNTGSGSTHNTIQPSITKTAAIKMTAATAVDQDVAAGTSIGGYWSAIPSGYLAENGAAVSRTTYATLFAAIGTTYGAGNGSSTFNLPDSRGRLGVNRSTDVEFDSMGEKYGTKFEVLTITQLPSHTHTQNSHAHGLSDPGHTHAQNGHVHAQYVTNPLAGGPAIRNDYVSDSGGAYYSQGINTGTTTATNNASGIGISINGATAANQNTGGGGSHNNIQPSIVKMFAIKY